MEKIFSKVLQILLSILLDQLQYFSYLLLGIILSLQLEMKKKLKKQNQL